MDSEILNIDDSEEVNPLSIQWLDLKKLAKFEKLFRNDDLGETVQNIIDEHNKKSQESKEKINGNKKKEGYTSRKLGNALKTTVKNAGYEAKAYARVNNLIPRVSKNLEKPENMKILEHILFFYKKNNLLIVLTSGNAWQVVRKFADHSFPTHVIERVGNPNEITYIERRCLFGSTTKEALLDPDSYALQLTASQYYLVESIWCSIKSDSVLSKKILNTIDNVELKLINNNRKKDRETKKIFTINCTHGGILKIKKMLSFKQYLVVFDLLAVYANQKTGTKRRAEEEAEENSFDNSKRPKRFDPQEINREKPDPLFEFLNFLQRCDEDLKEPLDKKLINEIFELHKTQFFQFRHKYLIEYLNSNTLAIRFNGKPFNYDKPPSMQDVVDDLVEAYSELDSATIKYSFHDLIKKTKIHFEDHKKNKYSEFILKCIEGELQYDGNSYFKIKGEWYQVEADYMALMYEDFKGVLRMSLIQKQIESKTLTARIIQYQRVSDMVQIE